MRRLGTLVAIATLLAGCGNKSLMTSPIAEGAKLATAANATAPRFANRVVVKYKANASAGAIRSFQQRFGLSTVRDVQALGMGVLSLPTTMTSATALTKLSGNAAVDYVEPDFVFSASPVKRTAAAAAATTRKLAQLAVANDSRVAEEWGMAKIGMPAVWSRNGGSPSLVVAVVDTGVDVGHPDLAAAMVPGKSMLPNMSGPNDDHGHGTHVAGVIAGSVMNASGIAGVAPNCKIMPVKVLNHEGKGDTGDIVAGLLWAVNNGAKVVNMSLGGAGGSRALMAAVAYAQSKDVLVVAAMGNEGENIQEYPAGYPGVMAVGATTEGDEKASFSNTGTWISVSAPGEEILSTLPRGNAFMITDEGKRPSYDYLDGTSMASPFVAGLAALVRSAEPGLTQAQVKARIEKTADDLGDPGFDPEFGWGRINAVRALNGR